MTTSTPHQASDRADASRTQRPTIALIAHDAKKQDIVSFAQRHRDILSRCHILATGTTGSKIAEATGLEVERVLSGPLGGDLQIGSRLACGLVAYVIFLRDPLTAHPHEPDIAALIKACDVHNIPLATNESGAEILIRHIGEHS